MLNALKFAAAVTEFFTRGFDRNINSEQYEISPFMDLTFTWERHILLQKPNYNRPLKK